MPLVLIGNKSDLRTKRAVSFEECSQYAKHLTKEFNITVPYFETSASTASQVMEAYKKLVTSLVKGKN